MKGISISRRLKLGLGSLAGVVFLLAVMAVGSSIFLLGEFHKFRAASAASGSANEIAEDVFEAQLAAETFRRTSEPDLITEFQENLSEVAIEVAKLEGDPSLGEAARSNLLAISNAKGTYVSSFEEIVTLDTAMDQSVNRMFDAGVAARQTMSDLMDAANRAGDAGQTFSAARVLQGLLLGRVYMTRHVLTGTEETFTTASEHLSSAAQQLSWMGTMAGDPDRAALVAKADEEIATFIAVAGEINGKIRSQGIAYTQMDQQRDIITGGSDALIDLLNTATQTTGQMMDGAFKLTSIVLSVAAAIALLYALFMARSTIRQIGSEFDTTLHAVSELADGRLDIEIQGKEHQTELGSIARALEVFRAKSIDAERLAKESEEARARAAAEERAREAEARDAEDRRQAEEQAAAERHKRKIFQDLSAAVSGVVTAAAAGDFSRRVDEKAVDTELRNLVEDINRLMSNVEKGLEEIANVSGRLAGGDLRSGMTGDFEGTFKELQDNIDVMIGSLGSILAEISNEARQVADQSADMTRGAEDLSRRAESQAASLEQTSASMTEIASSAESNAASAAETDTAATRMNDEADRARGVLESTVSAMRDIQHGSKEIEAIVDVIEDIAFQTNLLSLNASVEAARAGEAGKGFAVVANEVRALAQRSAEASSKVQVIIAQSTNAISRGSEAVEQTGTALEQIVDRIGTVSSNLREIKSASEEQAMAVKDISNAFGQLDKITQKNAAVAEQTRGTAGLLSSQSTRMQAAVGKVVLREQAQLTRSDASAGGARSAA
ncbi:MAG: methyl-accepting chemotaxis protein [Pseudomonadota bacterium]